jgi:transglutaminase-like putative cysteine protease
MSRPGQPAADAGRRDDGLVRATELALFGVTLAAIIGMHLLFADGSFFAPLFWQAVVAHLVLAVLRRREVRLVPAGLIAIAAAILSITWAQYLGTTVALLPSPDTLSTIDLQLDEAWRLFQDVRAPAPVVPGFVVSTSLAVWVIVFIADWGAFRTGVSFEALLPPATLFLFAAVLGEQGGSRAPGAALFVAAALVFLLLHRTWRQEGTSTWAAVNREWGRWSMLTSGAALAAVPVVASAIIGPNLPGADDPPVVPWRQLTDEEEPRVVISPLVDIRGRLVEQADVEVFTVQTDRPVAGPYWRLTALDSFDNTIWRSSYDTARADGELPDSVEADAETTHIEQTITVGALDAIWLPAAHEPVALDMGGSDTEVDYDPASATLIVDRDTPTSDGQAYTVTSEVPTWTTEQLRAASAEIPGHIADRYLDLPDDFSQQISDLAVDWTASAATPYDQAIALQTQLRTFDYDLDITPGHSEDALEQFLFVNRRGYCEQFAGAFAAMARSLGLPTRVAVGFTRGVQDPNEPTLWRVTGRQAHAWAEVYFEGLGWVTFDPTPGRGPSGAQDWLPGVTPEQAVPGGTETDPLPPPNDDPAPAPEVGGPQPDGGVSAGDANTDAGDVAAAPEEDNDRGFVTGALVSLARWGGLTLLGYLGLVPAALLGRFYSRRLRGRSPGEKVDLAWREATERAAESGVNLTDSLTVAERALRMRTALPEVAPKVELVAQWVEQVNYAEITPTPEQADEVARAASTIVTAAARRQRWYARVLRYLDARRLLPQPDHARRTAHGAIRTA